MTGTVCVCDRSCWLGRGCPASLGCVSLSDSSTKAGQNAAARVEGLGSAGLGRTLSRQGQDSGKGLCSAWSDRQYSVSREQRNKGWLRADGVLGGDGEDEHQQCQGMLEGEGLGSALCL